MLSFFATDKWRTAGVTPVVFVLLMGALDVLYKNRQKFSYPLYFCKGGKNLKILTQFSTPLVFRMIVEGIELMECFKNLSKFVKG